MFDLVDFSQGTMHLRFIILLFLTAVQVDAERCVTPNNEEGNCVHLPSCSILYRVLRENPNESIEEFAEKSVCGGTKLLPMVCCASSPNVTVPEREASSEDLTLLPSKQKCGYQHSDDYFRTSNDTSVRINEFPWLARIIHKSSSNENFLDCAGSLIANRYVLTSATCVDADLYEVVGVRLGEFYVKNKTDCVQEPPFEEECTSFEDFKIEKIIRHPNYSNINDANDIALIKLQTKVLYSDYIRPICLPSSEMKLPEIGNTLFTSGWGLSYNNTFSNGKKRILGKLIANGECKEKLSSSEYPTLGRKLTEAHMCTLQLENKSITDCYSDLGGPVMYSIGSQWYQEGIVYFSGSCQKTERPEIHTKVANYVEWIERSLEPQQIN